LSRSNVKPLIAVLAVALLVAAVAAGGRARTPEAVTVRVLGPTGAAELASGVVVAPGRVLTVAHVLAEGGRIEVDGRPATVARTRPGQDLALLDVPGVSGPDVRYGPARGPVRVLLPGGAERAALRRRIVAHLTDAPGRPRRAALELAVRVAPGDSGAPVVDADGDVVGILFARSTRREGTAYAVRTDVAAALP